MSSKRVLGRGLHDLNRRKPFHHRWSDSAQEPEVPPRSQAPSLRPYMICVTSGKGGTGKSFLTSNLSVQFAAAGLNTFVVDADLGMANLHLLLGIVPRSSLYQVAVMGVPVWDAAQKGPGGFWFLPGGSGVEELANLRASEVRFLVGRLRKLRRGLDILLVDTAAGIAHQTTTFLAAADMNLVVTTPDLTALTDAYALIKSIHQFNPRAEKVLLINRVRDRTEGDMIFARVSGIARKFLQAELRRAGSIPEDPAVRESVGRKSPVVVSRPQSVPARTITTLANEMALFIQDKRRQTAKEEAERREEDDLAGEVLIPEVVLPDGWPAPGS